MCNKSWIYESFTFWIQWYSNCFRCTCNLLDSFNLDRQFWAPLAIQTEHSGESHHSSTDFCLKRHFFNIIYSMILHTEWCRNNLYLRCNADMIQGIFITCKSYRTMSATCNPSLSIAHGRRSIVPDTAQWHTVCSKSEIKYNIHPAKIQT